MTTDTLDTASPEDPDDESRRDFIHIGAAAFGAVTIGGVVWPLIDQMNPDQSVLALATIEVDISSIEVGQSVVVKWRGKPVFIRHRTAEEIAEARAVPLVDLPDQLADNQGLPDDTPANDENRAIKEQYLIMIGICTHLGCIPLGLDDAGYAGEFGGWFCPCHGSHYDTSGRIRKGPAPRNLDIPPYEFIEDAVIRIG